MVTLGTATPGGGFPVYGEAVAAFVVNAVDPALLLTLRNTKGSTENVPLLEAGQLDLGLVQGEVAYEALSGVGRAPADLRILAAMYSTPGMFVVRAHSRDPGRSGSTGGRRVGRPGLGAGRAGALRPAHGPRADRDRDFQLIFLERAGGGRRRCRTGARPRCGAGARAGPASPRWRAARPAPGSSRPTPPASSASWRSTVPETADRPGRIVSWPGRAGRVGGLVELHHGAAELARRRRVPLGAGDPPRREAAGRALAPGERDDRREHGGAVPRPALIHAGALRYFREIGL